MGERRKPLFFQIATKPLLDERFYTLSARRPADHPESVKRSIAAVACALFLVGCPKRSTAPRPKEEHFWTECVETVPAKPDGYQHFWCTDIHGRHWEILAKLKGKP